MHADRVCFVFVLLPWGWEEEEEAKMEGGREGVGRGRETLLLNSFACIVCMRVGGCNQLKK